MKNFISILFLLTLFLGWQAHASFQSCFISRNGNEFWITHLPINTDTCDVTVRIKNIKTSKKPFDLEVNFITQKNSSSMILISFDGQPPFQLNTQGFFMVTLQQSTLKNDEVLLGCSMNLHPTPTTKTECGAARSYGTDNSPNLPKSGWVEEIP